MNLRRCVLPPTRQYSCTVAVTTYPAPCDWKHQTWWEQHAAAPCRRRGVKDAATTYPPPPRLEAPTMVKETRVSQPPILHRACPPHSEWPPQDVKMTMRANRNASSPLLAHREMLPHVGTGPPQAARTLRNTPHSATCVSPDVVISERGESLRSELQPSRNRLLPAALAITAAGAQRSGTALPSFPPRGLPANQALRVARAIDSFQRTLEIAFSGAKRTALQKVASVPLGVKSSRRKVIRHLSRLALSLQPAQQRLAATLPAKSPARDLHIPLIAFLVKKLGYEDTALPSDLVNGVNITGEIPASRVLAKRITPAQRRIATLRNGLKT